MFGSAEGPQNGKEKETILQGMGVEAKLRITMV